MKIAQNDTSIIPTLQVLDVKKIVTGTTGERYRLVLSDGSYYMQAILTTKCQKLVTEGLLKKYAIIDLTEFSCSNVSCKKICVIIDCNVNQQLQGKLGDPQNVRNINDQHRNQLKSPAISAKVE